MSGTRPVTEITRETVRIHAPYTHVPYHQRLDDGIVKFVNNDHCLLSERVGLPRRTRRRTVGQTLGREGDAERRRNHRRDQVGRQHRERVSVRQPLRDVQGAEQRGVGREDQPDAAEVDAPPPALRTLRNSGRDVRSE